MRVEERGFAQWLRDHLRAVMRRDRELLVYMATDAVTEAVAARSGGTALRAMPPARRTRASDRPESLDWAVVIAERVRELMHETILYARDQVVADLSPPAPKLRVALRQRLARRLFSLLIRGKGPVKTRLLLLERLGFLTRPRPLAVSEASPRSVQRRSIPLGARELSVA
ncbi:MAG TPA: hypothetical protein VEQ41_07755 [Solirubrobacterales bacterium]|nr:hypothetical protein [Solirubrobacterales bacterium]